MNINKRTVAVSTSAFILVGGTAFAFDAANQSSSTTSTTTLAHGQLTADWVTTASGVRLDQPAQVQLGVTALLGTLRITRVSVQANVAVNPHTGKSAWDYSRCGDPTLYFVPFDGLLAHPIDVPGNTTVVLDETNAPELKIKLLNDPHTDQSHCVLHLVAIVS